MNRVENGRYVDTRVAPGPSAGRREGIVVFIHHLLQSDISGRVKWSHDSALTEEAIQGVFQDLWQYRRTLGDVSSFEAYLKGSLKKSERFRR